MKFKYALYIAAISIFSVSCKKYLDGKPDKKLVIPGSLDDVQAMFDDNSLMNLTGPALGEISADNYYVLESRYNAMTNLYERNMYIWDANIWKSTSTPSDWQNPYAVVYNTNIGLETLAKINPSQADRTRWENLKGAAYFYRGKAFFDVVQVFAKAYDKAMASTEPGIPLRLSSDFNDVSTRASLEESYSKIISDLKASIPLLPVTVAHHMRPCRAAAHAMLARTFLAMGEYDQALLYADSSLRLNHELMDYNTLDTNSLSPIANFNPEVVMPFGTGLIGTLSRISVDSVLYASYAANDLRRPVFFRYQSQYGTYTFKGSYQNGYMFIGITTDEMWLTRAECYARSGQVGPAMDDLNHLLETRWKKGSFVPFTATSAKQALQIILAERRKELIFRNLRWLDIKRLNREGAAITLTRQLNGQQYILLPNDNRYALPIPPDVIKLSQVTQNPR